MKKTLAAILAFLFITTCMTGCGSKSGTTSEAAIASTSKPSEAVIDDTRTLKLCTNAAIETLDPQGTNNLKALWMIKQMYEGLVYYNYEDHTAEPRIAESYTMSEDGKTWTFKIRDGVKFHNGDTLTMDDVVFSYQRAMTTPAMATYTTAIDSVAAVDANTFEVKLKYTVAPFLQYVSEINILNKKFATEHSSEISTAICGTGPYKADKVDLALGVEASAFEEYYRGAPSIKKIKWDVITDAAAAAMAFEAGELDYLELAFSQYAGLKANPDFSTGFIPTRHTIWVSFNCSKAPL